MPGKILIVDDSDQNRLLIHDVLAYHRLVAPRRIEAIEQNHGDAAGQPGALRVTVREDPRLDGGGRRRFSRRMKVEETDVLRFSVILDDEVVLCKIGYELAFLVLGDNRHLYQPRGRSNHHRRLSLRSLLSGPVRDHQQPGANGQAA